jgi:hypothetical protein
MTMPYSARDNKEIRLFGEKSVREEAYRKKILQLEKEISNLEALAREQDEVEHTTPARQPKNLNNLYYESLMSFDARIKKENEFLEKRATEITERLDIQAQKAALNLERVYRRQARLLFFMIFVFAAFFVIILYYPRLEPISGRTSVSYSDSLSNRIPHIKNALLTQTKYRHNYTVSNIAVSANSYLVDIDLNSAPTEIWYLRDLTQDVVSLFNKSSRYAQAKISFIYDGKLYAKATLAGTSSSPYIRYYN